MLVDELKRVQADTFALYAQSHYYHWNIEDPHFPEYHAFLNEIYDANFDAVDDIAEQIRQLGAFAPTPKRCLDELSVIKVEEGIPSGIEMFRKLKNDNDTLMEGILVAYHSAEAEMQIGLSNFLQDRMMYHKKLDWMLKSITR